MNNSFESLSNPELIEQRILSLKKQKAYVERVKHRIECRLEKGMHNNGKANQYSKSLLKQCCEQMKVFEDLLKELETRKVIYSKFIA